MTDSVNTNTEDIATLNSNLNTDYNQYTFRPSVAANTVETVGTFTVTKGKWLIVCFMDLAASSTSVYVNIVNNRSVRNTASSGGGCINAMILNVTNTTETVTISVYSPIATTARATVDVIKLNG